MQHLKVFRPGRTLLLGFGFVFAIILDSVPRISVAGSRKSLSDGGVSFTHLYLPEDYDDNDPVSWVAEVELDDACTQVTSHRAALDPTQNQIELIVETKRASGDCEPIKKRVNLEFQTDALSSGTYSVQNAGRVLGVLEVSHSNSDHEDSSSLAPVSEVQVTPAAGGGWILHMSGIFSDDCLTYGRTGFHAQTDVITVEPISRLWEFGCGQKTDVPFAVSASLPVSSSVPSYLIHVRSAGGISLNYILDRGIATLVR